jgi:hypothetical protein
MRRKRSEKKKKRQTLEIEKGIVGMYKERKTGRNDTNISERCSKR